MDPVRPEFVPDPSLSRAEMESLQRDIADAAAFTDDLPFDSANVGVGDDAPATTGEQTQTRLDDTAGAVTDRADPPLIAGVDQAFVDDRAVSVIVCLRGDEVVERVHAVEPVEIPYVPGLLSFREGGAIVSAFAELSTDPDLAVFDGSGRIHFRQAGLATHLGVTLDVPAVGVAKNLLCGRPRESLDRKLPVGVRVPIEADDEVTAPEGAVIGHALQTRQFESGDRYINPLYVSPGHRVSAETTADLVERCCDGYKLPEPTRLADGYADEMKADLRGT
jgi:deoxyribonuclease V